jgi:hypothetical protein
MSQRLPFPNLGPKKHNKNPKCSVYNVKQFLVIATSPAGSPQVFVEAAGTLFLRSRCRTAEFDAGQCLVADQADRGSERVSRFERVGKKVTLTDAFRNSAGVRAKQVLQSLRDADQAMTALNGMSGGRVS